MRTVKSGKELFVGGVGIWGIFERPWFRELRLPPACNHAVHRLRKFLRANSICRTLEDTTEVALLNLWQFLLGRIILIISYQGGIPTQLREAICLLVLNGLCVLGKSPSIGNLSPSDVPHAPRFSNVTDIATGFVCRSPARQHAFDRQRRDSTQSHRVMPTPTRFSSCMLKIS